MPWRILPLAAALAALAACESFPELDAAARAEIAVPGPYPAILPVDGLVASAEGARITDEGSAALQARAAGLQARGAALAGPVMDPATQARLTAAATR
jgi:hypothetical protein